MSDPVGAGEGDPGRESVAAWLVARSGGRTSAVVPLSGDASTRRYFRVTSGERSTIAALYPEPFDPKRLSFLEVGALLGSWGLPVPEVLDVDGGRGIIEVEDLGDVSLQDRVTDASRAGHPEIRSLYREAMLGLVALQDASLRAAGAASCFGLAFDEEKLSFELAFFTSHFLGGLRGVRIEEMEAAELETAFGSLSREIAGWSRVLCHRDFHSRNLMWHGGRLRWIDFQDARMGPAHYDLASLLRDSYVDLDEEMVEDLIAEFRERAVPGETPAEFRRRFDLVSVQRNLKALGTFGYLATVRGMRRYLDFVPRTLERVRGNLSRQDACGRIGSLLARHLPELRA